MTQVVPPRGNTGGTPDTSYATTYAYDGAGSQAGLLQTVTDPDGDHASYGYDAVGRRTAMTDPDGNGWGYQYDGEDRPTKTIAPAVNGSQPTVTIQYDGVGNRTVFQDQKQQVTKYLYDVRELLSEVDQSKDSWTDPAATPPTMIETTYQYDNLGYLKRTARDAAGMTERATDTAYDGRGKLRTETQYPGWPSTSGSLLTSYVYDGNANLTSRADPKHQTTTTTYDPLNRPTQISYSNSNTHQVNYGYDADGSRLTMDDGTGHSSYQYDEQDRPTAVTSPATTGSKTVGYRYDLDGNRAKILYPDGFSVAYTYDKADRLTQLQDSANRLTKYDQYYPSGQLKHKAAVNGSAATYTLDADQRLTDVENDTSGGALISSHVYRLDATGLRSHADEQVAEGGNNYLLASQDYQYDGLYRLVQDGNNASPENVWALSGARRRA